MSMREFRNLLMELVRETETVECTLEGLDLSAMEWIVEKNNIAKAKEYSAKVEFQRELKKEAKEVVGEIFGAIGCFAMVIGFALLMM